MSIFDALGEIYKNLTVNENVTAIDEEKAKKEAEKIAMKYNEDIEEKEKEVGEVHISLEEKEEKESIVPEAKVDEALADKTAKEKATEKGTKQKGMQRGE